MTTWCLAWPGDPVWWQAFAGLVQALVAVAQAFLAYYVFRVARWTAQMQKDGERRELYGRRVKVYDALMVHLAGYARDVKAGFQIAMQLYRDTREAEFLFGPEIPALIDRIAKSINELWTIGDEDKIIAAGDTANTKRIQELKLWLVTGAFDEAKQKFGAYLRLADPDAVSNSSK